MKYYVSGKLSRHFKVPDNPALSKLSSWYLHLVPIVSRSSCLLLECNGTRGLFGCHYAPMQDYPERVTSI